MCMKKILMTALVCSAIAIGCKDDKIGSDQYDPSQPVQFTGFTPKEGAMRTRLYIEGSNFGSDVSKIHITIGGVTAKTIGADGKKIYCMVPPRAFDGTINVKVEDETGNTVADYTFDEPFAYQAATSVGTLLRRVDEDGNSPFQDGSFDEGASVPSNDHLMFDPKDQPGDDQWLFSANYYDGLRIIDITNREVRRLFPRTMYKKMYSFTFTNDGDTLLFTDDHGQDNTTRANIYYALRRENFRRIRPYNYGRTSYSVVSMSDGTMFYSTWTNAEILKLVRNDGYIPNIDENAQVMVSLNSALGTGGQHSILHKHPSENFIYVLADGMTAIVRLDYDKVTKTLHSPRVIAGQIKSASFQEGTGSTARFNKPWKGVFVKNDDYGEGVGPDKDQYDFYFTDYNNHCLWKLDPNGIATCVAGRSNENADGRIWGYVDGDPLHEARFNKPSGIAYDPENEVFYMGDTDNKAVRYMRTE